MARTNVEVPIRYRMRHDNVLIKVVPVEKVRGLFMPQASVEGKQYRVEEIGPKVKDLKVGDMVLIKGKVGVDVGMMPTDSTLLITSDENVMLVVEPQNAEDLELSLPLAQSEVAAF